MNIYIFLIHFDWVKKENTTRYPSNIRLDYPEYIDHKGLISFANDNKILEFLYIT